MEDGGGEEGKRRRSCGCCRRRRFQYRGERPRVLPPQLAGTAALRSPSQLFSCPNPLSPSPALLQAPPGTIRSRCLRASGRPGYLPCRRGSPVPLERPLGARRRHRLGDRQGNWQLGQGGFEGVRHLGDGTSGEPRTGRAGLGLVTGGGSSQGGWVAGKCGTAAHPPGSAHLAGSGGAGTSLGSEVATAGREREPAPLEPWRQRYPDCEGLEGRRKSNVAKSL